MPTKGWPEMREWLALPEGVQRNVLEAIATGLGSDFRLVQAVERVVERKPPSEWDAASLDRHHDALATTEQRCGWTLRHSPTGTAFSFIPGGASAIGIGDVELTSLQDACTAPQWELLMEGVGRSLPARIVQLEPFLLASAPATGRALQALGIRLDDPRVSRLYSGPHCVTYLDPSELDSLRASAASRLPRTRTDQGESYFTELSTRRFATAPLAVRNQQLPSLPGCRMPPTVSDMPAISTRFLRPAATS